MNLITELSTYLYADLTRTACIARVNEDMVPNMMEMNVAWGAFRTLVKYEAGETPRKKPAVTMDAARMTVGAGVLRVWTADTAMVIGRARPRAIYESTG